MKGITNENCDVALKEDKVDTKNLSELKGFYEQRGVLLNFKYLSEKSFEDNHNEFLSQMIENFKF